MELSSSTSANTGFITLIGQLWQKEDLRSVEEAVEKILVSGILQIVLNVDRLSFISSQGLGLIARVFARLQEKNGIMLLFNPHSSVLEVIEISGFDLFMKIVKTEEELNKLLK
jgi:anti-sigma B factor antagonist